MYHARNLSALLLLAALALTAGAGCGGSGEKPVKVEGIVTLDGKPLPDAAVTFQPLEAKGRPATGVTGSDGVFRLTTFNSGDGAFPGQYKILVTKTEERAADSGGVQVDPSDPQSVSKAMAKMMANQAKNKKTALPKSQIPIRYGTGDTPLRATVPSDGRVAIDLKSTGGS